CALSTNGRVHYHFQWQPDAVIINLGTNDQSALNKLPESERSGRLHLLETEAVAFLHMIRKHYPNAYLLWVYGMAGQTLSGVFRYAIASAKREGLTRIGYLRLLECTPEQMGARQHPGIENHRKAKERILSYLVNNDAVHISPSKR
ncbi:MAG: hypothetical protein IJ242_07840, partial [Clostridia bacterium]|nr:hypothetical protein [Clostridia bacterium]